MRHSYTLAIWPDEPIVVGKKVKILAATPIAYHLPDSPSNELDTYDPHVMGHVVEVRRMEDGVAVARIANGCRGNRVEEVELAFPSLLQKGVRPERRAPGVVTVETKGEEDLDPLVCIRPMLAVCECRGIKCWLKEATRIRMSATFD